MNTGLTAEQKSTFFIDSDIVNAIIVDIFLMKMEIVQKPVTFLNLSEPRKRLDFTIMFNCSIDVVTCHWLFDIQHFFHVTFK
jgi:hypothetical protein